MRALAFCVWAWSAPAAAGEITVDFEAASDGTPLVEGDDTVARFDDWHVSFYLPGLLRPPRIASEGRPCRAFETFVPGVGIVCDAAVSGSNVLTDGGRVYAELGASFLHPVSEASLSLVDFGDCVSRPMGSLIWVELRALDALGGVVATDAASIQRHTAGDPDDGNVITLTVSGADIVAIETRGAARDCGKAIDDVRFVLQDGDGDGTIDGDDLCPDTAAGALTDLTGCDAEGACPCEDGWANHGAYVSCVADFADGLEAAGLVDANGHGELVSAAATSDCGLP